MMITGIFLNVILGVWRAVRFVPCAFQLVAKAPKRASTLSRSKCPEGYSSDVQGNLPGRFALSSMQNPTRTILCLEMLVEEIILMGWASTSCFITSSTSSVLHQQYLFLSGTSTHTTKVEKLRKSLSKLVLVASL